MKRRTRLPQVLWIAALSFTAACGGGSTSETTTVSFASLESTAGDLIGGYVTDTGSIVSGLARASDFSSAGGGNATYDGQFLCAVEGYLILGGISLDVDLGTGEVSGNGTDFQHEIDGSYAGTLSGTGVFDSDAAANFPQLTIVLRGTLSDEGIANETAIALDGDFFANGSDATGAVAGTAEGSLGGSPIADGIFAAER